MQTKPVVFDYEEMQLLGIILMVAMGNMAEMHRGLQDALDHNQIEGGLQSIITAMEVVKISKQQMDVLERITDKLMQSIPD